MAHSGATEVRKTTVTEAQYVRNTHVTQIATPLRCQSLLLPLRTGSREYSVSTRREARYLIVCQGSCNIGLFVMSTRDR